MPRVLFLEQYFYPEGWGGAELPRDVTLHLRGQGFDVEVLCGSDPYVEVQGDPGPDPGAAGIRIRRLPRLFSGDIHRHKLLRQLWFYLATLPFLFMRRPPDVFMAQTNPPLSVVMLAIAASVFRKPLVIVAQDLYPESLVVHGLVREGSVAEKVLRATFGWAYRSARTVIVLGPVMRERVLAKGVCAQRITEISNWATGPLDTVERRHSMREQWGLGSSFVVLYSGNMGLGHEFATLLDGFALARRTVPTLKLVFVGKGSRRAEVEAGVAARGLGEAVTFRGFVPSSDLSRALATADLAVVTLREGFEGLIVPSKLFGHMARGIPTLYVGPRSDISLIVTETRAGFVCNTGDASGVERAIVEAFRDPAALHEMGKAGQRAYEARFTRERSLHQYAEVVERVVGR